MHELRPVAIVALSILVTVIAASPALAGGAELIFAQSPEYQWTSLDLIQNGQTMPTSVYPLTLEEYYATVLHQELPTPSDVANQFVFSVTPGYTGFDTPYGSITSTTVGLYDKVQPTVVIGDKFSVKDSVYVNLSIDLSPPERLLFGQGSYKLWKPTDLTALEFPRQSYGVLSMPHASLAAGRFKTGVGNGYFGGTYMNGKAPYYDQVQITYYSEHFKFYYMLGTSSPYLTAPEEAIQMSTTNWDPLNNTDHAPFNEPIKVFAFHHIDYRPADWIVLGFGEMNLIGGKTPEFNHINPFGFWHNTYTAGFSNVLFSLDASVVPFKGLNIFGELTVDDIQASWAESSDSKPTTLIWQVGARYVMPFSKTFKHVVGAEFTHADPWAYNRWQPYLIMYQRQILNGGSSFVDVPLAFPYGGDLNHYGFYYNVIDRNGFSVQASYDHLDKGPIELGMIDSTGNPIYYNHPDWLGITTGPFGHGTVEQRDSVSLSLAYPLPYSLTFLTSGQYTWIHNYQHQEGVSETISFFTVGLRWSY